MAFLVLAENSSSVDGGAAVISTIKSQSTGIHWCLGVVVVGGVTLLNCAHWMVSKCVINFMQLNVLCCDWLRITVSRLSQTTTKLVFVYVWTNVWRGERKREGIFFKWVYLKRLLLCPHWTLSSLSFCTSCNKFQVPLEYLTVACRCCYCCAPLPFLHWNVA